MGTITKHIKTITGKGFISDQENNKVDVIYRIEIFQDFTLSGNNEIPGMYSNKFFIQFLIEGNQFKKIVNYANGGTGTLECEKGKATISFLGIDISTFTSQAVLSPNNDQTTQDWLH